MQGAEADFAFLNLLKMTHFDFWCFPKYLPNSVLTKLLSSKIDKTARIAKIASAPCIDIGYFLTIDIFDQFHHVLMNFEVWAHQIYLVPTLSLK